jgi:hypothetical protein
MKKFKNIWAIQSPKGDVVISSINWQKKMAISGFCGVGEWVKYRGYGWKAIKINIEISLA